MTVGSPHHRSHSGVWNTMARVFANLFGTRTNAVITAGILLLLWQLLPPVFRWAITDATFSGNADACDREGACWAFVAAKFRFIIFAFYPPDLQWRPLLVMVLLGAILTASAMPRFWGRPLLAAWPVTVVICWILMEGDFSASPVPSNQWGGLPVTLFVWAVCFAAATPVAVLLALARRSRLGGLRTFAVIYIEVMRGTPMVAILYVAMLILPMALPEALSFDKMLRAMIMITLFWAAYIAEVIRAGLQAIPHGQSEASTALGLGYWRTQHLVILPQALRIVIPGMVNLAIGFLLATSLLAVIGIFDLLNAARGSAADPAWLGFYNEAYLVVAIVYFVICSGASHYSRWLEQRLGAGTRKI